MTDPRFRVLSLFLSLLLFPLFPARTALAEPAPWRWPLESPVVVLRGFDPPAQRWLPGHLGVDLAAEPGRPVYPAGPGRVRFAGRVAGVGVVSVAHGELRTTYLPVDPHVARGDPVDSDPIGVIADEPRHCPRRSCLHWGLLRGSTYLDPLSLLGRGEVRLLPLGERAELKHGGGPDDRRRVVGPRRRACRSGCCVGWRAPGTPAHCADRLRR